MSARPWMDDINAEREAARSRHLQRMKAQKAAQRACVPGTDKTPEFFEQEMRRLKASSVLAREAQQRAELHVLADLVSEEAA